MNDFLLSSTGEGVKLRIKALALLIIPVLNFALEKYGVNVIPDSVNTVIDSAAILLAAGLHAWGWIRAMRAPKA